MAQGHLASTEFMEIVHSNLFTNPPASRQRAGGPAKRRSTKSLLFLISHDKQLPLTLDPMKFSPRTKWPGDHKEITKRSLKDHNVCVSKWHVHCRSILCVSRSSVMNSEFANYGL